MDTPRRRKDFKGRKEVEEREIMRMLVQNDLIIFSVAAFLAIMVYCLI